MSAIPAASTERISGATRHQPRARMALVAALAGEPSHAYLFRGPRGAGKSEAARVFAAEILALGAPDPDDARRRALVDPSPHPDLVWLRPPGAQHLVEEVRESVIRAASLRPAEGDRRVFVIDQAEALRDESQNALLKTLEEPAAFAHMVLICSEPELLAGTILSRCQTVSFVPLPPQAVEQRLAAEHVDGTVGAAAARLCGGDLELARLLASPEGAEIRARAEHAARAPLGELRAESPWRQLLDGAEGAGAAAGAAEEERLCELAESTGGKGRTSGKLSREDADQVKRAERRERTRVLDLGLALCSSWYRDLAAAANGAAGVLLNADRASELATDANGLDPRRARAALELVLDTRRRLRLNVSEELALDALWLRLGEALEG